MGETAAANNHRHHHHHGHQVFDVASHDFVPPQPAFKCFDDDGRLKRTGHDLKHNKNTCQTYVSFIVL